MRITVKLILIIIERKLNDMVLSDPSLQQVLFVYFKQKKAFPAPAQSCHDFDCTVPLSVNQFLKISVTLDQHPYSSSITNFFRTRRFLVIIILISCLLRQYIHLCFIICICQCLSFPANITSLTAHRAPLQNDSTRVYYEFFPHTEVFRNRNKKGNQSGHEVSCSNTGRHDRVNVSEESPPANTFLSFLTSEGGRPDPASF